MEEGMRKKRPVLLFWLIGFFLLLILSVTISGRITTEIVHTKTEKIVASKESVDKFRKEFSTYWWEDYKFEADYDQGELVIYLPKGKEDNQFTNIDDVLSAISLRQYQFKDKRLTVLLLSNSGEKLARLKNGKVTKGYSDKVDKKVVASRLAEWKKTNTPTKTSDSSHPKTTIDSTTAPPATNSSESSSTSSHLSGTSQ